MSELGEALRLLATAGIGHNAHRAGMWILAENSEGRKPTLAEIRRVFDLTAPAATRVANQLVATGLFERPTQRSGIRWARVTAGATDGGPDEPGEEGRVTAPAVAEGYNHERVTAPAVAQGRVTGPAETHAQRETVGSSTTVSLSGHELPLGEQPEGELPLERKLADAPIDGARARKLLNDQGFPWQKVLMGSTGRMIQEWVDREATEAEVRHGFALAHETNRGRPDSPRYYQWAVRQAIEESRNGGQRKAPDGAGADTTSGGCNDERGRATRHAPEIIHGLDDKDYGDTQVAGWLQRRMRDQ